MTDHDQVDPISSSRRDTHVPPDGAPGADAEDSPSSSRFFRRISRRENAFDRYQHRGQVAEGGMGVILKIWDADLRRNLAMKVMRTQFGQAVPSSSASGTSEIVLGRFLEEAQVTAQLDHPGIVPVHEIGLDDDGRAYFTMRLVQGRDLKKIFDLVRDGQDGWTTVRALGALLRVCEAMAYAHSKGVIHRDLKPANVMVGRFGEVYVMDWGIARVMNELDDSERRRRQPEQSALTAVLTERADARDSGSTHGSALITMDGDIVGTPAYMSPEQALGIQADVGPPTDVYAVGAMLYHLLGQQMPYVKRGERISARAVCELVQERPPQPLVELTPDAPDELIAICEKAMSRRIDDRYQDMGQLAEDLRAFLENRVVKAHRTGPLTEFRKWVRRNRAFAVTILCAMVVIVGGSTGAAVKFARQSERISDARDEAEDKRREAEAALVEARRQTYLASITAAVPEVEGGQAGPARRHLEAAPAELRGWEWQHLDLRRDLALASLPGHAGGATGAVFGAGGATLITAGRDGALRLWDARTGESLGSLRAIGAAVLALATDSAGGLLAIAAEDGVVALWEVASRTRLRELQLGAGPVSCLALSDDGTRVAAGSDADGVRLWDVASGELLQSFEDPWATVVALAFGPGGDPLVGGFTNGTVRTWRLADGKVGDNSSARSGRLASLAIAPDGSSVATGVASGIQLHDLATGRLLATLEGHASAVFGLAFADEGRTLVSAGGDPGASASDNALRIWDLQSGALRAVLPGHEGRVEALSFSSGSRRIASASLDGSVRLWDLETGAEPVVLAGHAADARVLAVSRDGRSVATGSDDETTRVWDAETGGLITVLRGGDRKLGAVAFHPDGSRLATGSFDRTIRLWDTRSWLPIAELHGHTGSVRALAFTPDGSRLLSSGADETLRAWNVDDGELVQTQTAHAGAVLCLRVDAAGARVLTGGEDGEVRLWDAATLQPLATLKGHAAAVVDVGFHPDGKRVVSASTDGTLRIWDAAGGEAQRVLSGHRGGAFALAVSPDGSRLMSGGEDGTLRVWETQTGDALATLQAGPSGVWALAFTPGGGRLYSAGADGALRVWDSEREPALRLWRAAARRSIVRPVVDALFEQHLLVVTVIAALQGMRELDEEQVSTATQMARARGNPNPLELNEQAWDIVSVAGLARRDYEQGMRLVAAARTLDPASPYSLNTLGVAQCRLGSYAEALATLERSDALNVASEEPYNRAEDLVFIALCHHELGDVTRAKALLQEVRVLTAHEDDEMLADFISEVTAALNGL